MPLPTFSVLLMFNSNHNYTPNRANELQWPHDLASNFMLQLSNGHQISKKSPLIKSCWGTNPLNVLYVSNL